MESTGVQSGPIRSGPMETAGYSSEDVQQILAIALAGTDSFSAMHLQEMARDLSIDDVVLSEAIDAWQANKTRLLKKRQQRQAFYRQALVPYLVVNTFLVLLNLSLAGAITWSIYPVLGWGVGLFLGPCQNRLVCRGVS